MKEAKFTPGPLVIKHKTNIFGIRQDVGHEGCVANTGSHSSNKHDCDPENEANAALFAAAPDLYEALVNLLAIQDCTEDCWCIESRPVKCEACAARAALAKARGE